MDKLTKPQIKKIRNYFAKQKDITAVYLYGSFAKGSAHKGSDIDIAVVFNKPVDSYLRLGHLYSSFPDLGISAEPEVRNINLDDPPIFLMNVIQGELIYAKNDVERINFEVAVMRAFYDTQKLREVDYYYMKKRLQEGSYGH